MENFGEMCCPRSSPIKRGKSVHGHGDKQLASDMGQSRASGIPLDRDLAYLHVPIGLAMCTCKRCKSACTMQAPSLGGGAWRALSRAHNDRDRAVGKLDSVGDHSESVAARLVGVEAAEEAASRSCNAVHMTGCHIAGENELNR